MMLLIHPPVSKPCEPPAGIARLSGALNSHGIKHQVLDANLEGLLNLLHAPIPSPDTWTSRALRHLPRHLDSLTSWKAYQKMDDYRRAVKDLNRILEVTGSHGRVRIGLANYEHEDFSPTRSIDLIKAAENPDSNPFYPYFQKRFSELLDAEESDVIGFSLNFLSQALTTFAMIGFLKEEAPNSKIILGGGLVTSWMRRPGWKNPFTGLADYLVAGPGEAPLLAFLNEKISEDDHPRPDYSQLSSKKYLAPGLILPYSASSGCYWNQCSFCPEKAEGNPYLPVPVEKVIDDLHHLAEKEKPILIHLLDNAISPSLMKKISENPPGVPWYGFARFTNHLTDFDFCVALKQSGCVMLSLGLESGDQTVLDSLSKGIDLKEVSFALKNLKIAGIGTYLYLLFGTPQETTEEARKTLDFVVRHCDSIGFLNLAVFNMPLHGPEVEQMETELFYEGDLSLYANFKHPKGWSRQSIRQFLDKEFKRHLAVSPILRRDPPVFTSSHAAFFTHKETGEIKP